MSRLITQRPALPGLEIRTAQRLDASAPPRYAASIADAPGPRRPLHATLPGPSRRITVEPLTVPAPAPVVPAPAPEAEPEPEPLPVTVPASR